MAFSMDSFVLDTTCGLVEILITIIDFNKYVKIKPKGDAWFVSDSFF
jgi:hypothetical protein